MTMESSYRADIAQCWCMSIRQTVTRIQTIKMDCELLASEIDGIKGISYECEGVHGGGMEHGDDRLAAAIIKMDEYRERLADAMLQLIDERTLFDSALSRMENQSYARLIKLRYLHNMEWSDVAKQVPYSYDHLCTYAHTSALLQLYDCMPKSMQIPEAI